MFGYITGKLAGICVPVLRRLAVHTIWRRDEHVFFVPTDADLTASITKYRPVNLIYFPCRGSFGRGAALSALKAYKSSIAECCWASPKTARHVLLLVIESYNSL